MFAAASPSLFTLTDFIPLAIFGLFAALAWFGLEYMAAAKPRALERLEEIRNPQRRRAAQTEAILKKPTTVSMVLKRPRPSASPSPPRARRTRTNSRSSCPAPVSGPTGWCRSSTV